MPAGRIIRLLLVLILSASLGGAVRVAHLPDASVDATGPTLSPPTQSLPPLAHDEATCGFCQAATFPPCTPYTVSVPAALLETVRERIVSPEARLPHTEARRLAESRAPPQLRIV
jgi:hypothetical protein